MPRKQLRITLACLGALALAAPAGAHAAAAAAWADVLILKGGRVQRQHQALPPLSRSFPPLRAAPRGSPPAPAPATAAADRSRSVPRPSVAGALSALAAGGQLSSADASRYRSQYDSARRAVTRVLGTRRLELGAVISNMEAMAAAGRFTPSRLPALFLTLDGNRRWWTTGPLLTNGQRVGFPDSQLIWQYYAGQGIEIQWLGTFGKANGHYEAGDDRRLRALLTEALPLAAQRAGGISWEYLFQFDGGRPPWTSGMSQGTAVQAYARGWSRLHDDSFRTAAAQALGVFQTPPPEGVRIATAAGAHYLEYSYAPRLLILNGFIQALVGLYDYSSLTGDPTGQRLFASGDGEGRVEVPGYDTGAWSLYDQYGESDLSYHQLLRDFLRNLCQRTRRGPLSPPGVPGAAVPGAGGAASGSVPAQSGGAPAGGTATAAGARRQAGSPNPDAIYCSTADRFTAYLHTPPSMSLVTTRVVGGRPSLVRFSLSKVSAVSVSISAANGRTQLSRRFQANHGTRALAWTPPRQPGVARVTLSATDLAGNQGSATGAVAITAPAPRGQPGARRARH